MLAFTKAPPRTAFKIEPKPVSTALFAALPIDPREALQDADAALPQRLAIIKESVANAICARRVKEIECVSGRLEGEVSRNGPLQLTARDGKLHLSVPLKYDIIAHGVGWAKSAEEKMSATLTASTQLDAVLHSGHSLELTAPDAWQWSEREANIGKGHLDVAKIAGPKLPTVATAFAATLATTLAAQPVNASILKIWHLLQEPLQIARSPDLWLAADVQRIGGAGFQQDDHTLVYRVAFGVRASVHDAKPPLQGAQRSVTNRRPPAPSRLTPDMATTQLRLPVLIGNDRLQALAARVFPAQETLETQPDRFAEKIQVTTRRAGLYASQRLLALELDLDLVTPKAVTGRKGRLHLLGRPVFDAQHETIIIDSVSMPAMTARDVRENQQTRDTPPVRLGSEPFASRFTSGARIDISQDVRDAVARTNTSFESSVGPGTLLSAHISSGVAQNVEPTSEGLVVVVAMTGQVILRPEPSSDGAVAIIESAEQIPSRASSARLPTNAGITTGSAPRPASKP